MNSKLPYSVPEGYFENLEDRALEKVSRRRGFAQKMAPLLAVAASMVVLLGIGSFIIGRSSSPESTQAEVAQVSPTAAAMELSEDDIIDFLVYSNAPLAYFDESF